MLRIRSPKRRLSRDPREHHRTAQHRQDLGGQAYLQDAVFDTAICALVQKREKLLLKYVKLFYQDVLAHVKEYWEDQADE